MKRLFRPRAAASVQRPAMHPVFVSVRGETVAGIADATAAMLGEGGPMLVEAELYAPTPWGWRPGDHGWLSWETPGGVLIRSLVLSVCEPWRIEAFADGAVHSGSPRAPRIPVSVPLVLRRLAAGWQCRTLSQDISLTGLRWWSRLPLPAHVPYRVELHFGTAVWSSDLRIVRQAAQGRLYTVAGRFAAVTAADRHWLSHLLSSARLN